MNIGILNIIGIILIILTIIAVGIYSGSKVKNASDFATGGGTSGSLMVCGTIMGSLVSGQATVGTAQLAFTYGLSAWWFTLGAGLGCLVLGLVYASPLRKSGNITLLQIIKNEYGPKAESLGSILCTIGIFISVIAQVIAASALLMTIFSMNFITASLISVLLMAVYVIFGGAWGAGMGGVVKLILLYASGIIGFIVVIMLSGNIGSLYDSIKSIFEGTALGQINGLSDPSAITARYSSLVSRGTEKDIGSGISLILGVIATQTYAQAIWSAKSTKAAKKGALLSAALIPPIGIACTLIGLFMRTRCITTDEIAALNQAGMAVPSGLHEISSTAQAFPEFAVMYMPKLIGGIVLGTLLITVVGGGAGLSLGMATIVVNDILIRINNKFAEAKKNLVSTRCTIFAILAAGAIIAIIIPGAVINDFGFLSMGIRGTVVLLPMTTGLFINGKIPDRAIIISMIAGPAAVIVGNIIHTPIAPLFIGLIVCVVILAVGGVTMRRSH